MKALRSIFLLAVCCIAVIWMFVGISNIPAPVKAVMDFIAGACLLAWAIDSLQRNK